MRRRKNADTIEPPPTATLIVALDAVLEKTELPYSLAGIPALF